LILGAFEFLVFAGRLLIGKAEFYWLMNVVLLKFRERPTAIWIDFLNAEHYIGLRLVGI
jgi:hypothetical protein